jgi:glucosamine kinase
MSATYCMGVDGGGTGTRLRLFSAEGAVLGEGRAGPSALGQGVEQAWRHILQAARQAVADAVSQNKLAPGSQLDARFMAQTRLGLGLSGAENAAWVADFNRHSPGWAEQRLVSDGLIAVLGAHAGQAGAVLSVGTGTVGVALHTGERVSLIGGWGWHLGDEASGSWMGRQAIVCAQLAIDGRGPRGPLAEAVMAHCAGDRLGLLDWCARVGQAEVAALAPLVFSLEASDPAAAHLVSSAVRSVEIFVQALDPHGALPLVIVGSVGERLCSRLSAQTQHRLVTAQADACQGARLLFEHPWSFLDGARTLHQDALA